MKWLLTALACLVASAASAQETKHYTSGSNMVNGVYVPAPVGFNLADVSSVGNVERLPEGVQALVYISSSMGCGGDTSAFRAFIDPFVGVAAKVWGFYVIDEPYVKGYGGKPPCPPANLLAQTRYIKQKLPNAKTYMKMGNSDGQANPNYEDYTPSNTGIDAFGVGGYMCRSDFVGKTNSAGEVMTDGCDWTMIDRYVNAAEKHIPTANLVPTYQSFAGWRTEASGGVFLMPTQAQLQKLLKQWQNRLPHPLLEYAYAWGCQEQSTDCLSRDAGLQAVYTDWFKDRATPPEPSPEPPTEPEKPGGCCCCCER